MERDVAEQHVQELRRIDRRRFDGQAQHGVESAAGRRLQRPDVAHHTFADEREAFGIRTRRFDGLFEQNGLGKRLRFAGMDVQMIGYLHDSSAGLTPSRAVDGPDRRRR